MRSGIAEFDRIDWTRPWFRPFAGVAASGLPLHGEAEGLKTAGGHPLVFVPQSDLPEGVAYETHIHATGRVPTRDNLHDAFNALIWRHFPETKSLLNRLQADAIARDGVLPVRGGLRDAATLFDENAVLFLTEDPALAEALRGFAWRTLFVTARQEWGRTCGVVPFGHALLEKLTEPYKAITAHAWWLPVPPDTPRATIDTILAASLAAAAEQGALRGGRSFAPLPVMGIPGWCDENQNSQFYEDKTVFRPGRRRHAG